MCVVCTCCHGKWTIDFMSAFVTIVILVCQYHMFIVMIDSVYTGTLGLHLTFVTTIHLIHNFDTNGYTYT